MDEDSLIFALVLAALLVVAHEARAGFGRPQGGAGGGGFDAAQGHGVSRRFAPAQGI